MSCKGVLIAPRGEQGCLPPGGPEGPKCCDVGTSASAEHARLGRWGSATPCEVPFVLILLGFAALTETGF